MSYYPKTQIKTNLFTNGKDYILSSDKTSYQGPYYELSTGKKYTGKKPQDGINIELFPIEDNTIFPTPTENNNPILLIQSPISKTLPDRNIPQFNPTTPTSENQQQGQFSRYFCKKTNENRYLEIDFNTYNKLRSQDPKIAWDLYLPIQIIWLIKGNQEQVYNSNKGSVQSIEQNNSWYGFSQYFKNDFSKYYLGV
jgi:hypothetical protein